MRNLSAILVLALAAACASGAGHTTTTPAQARISPCPEVQPVAGRIGPVAPIPSDDEIRRALDSAFAVGKQTTGGKNADYIPVLAKVDPNLFAVVVVTVEGRVFTLGDTKHMFSIQSVAKPFTLARDLEELGPKEIERRIGVGATGMPFNSIMAMELQKQLKRPVPGNPLVNAGAIATVSYLPARTSAERWQKIIDTMSGFAGRQLTVDEEVYRSETETNTRNRAISWLLTADEFMGSDPMEALDLYTRECSIAVNARDLAVMGATLANGGMNPVTGQQIVKPATAAQVLATMMTAGLYENTGQWAFEVGAPAKSGVGGGIVTVVPGRFAIATFAPPLDEAGNSVRGQAAIRSFVGQLGGNLFAASAASPARAEK